LITLTLKRLFIIGKSLLTIVADLQLLAKSYNRWQPNCGNSFLNIQTLNLPNSLQADSADSKLVIISKEGRNMAKLLMWTKYK
jgi:hypothetical protein